ncbi:efflux RND transporter periplasmic adaptor subunit [Paenibacillus agilis]|uniref:efflux RND transporter periplasmic adaptor subunit n=1 Tax=Paenibacillus agilis TaxID=3020863 RepID=UPI0021BD9EDB|nr:efflux RND transporter periplasmic adaptor subunit [Paenibacillus agilis]
MKIKKAIKWTIILALLGGISYGLYSFSQPKTMPLDTAGQEDLTFPVTKETLVKTIAITGKSSYVSETIVYAPFNGKVNKWNVKDGQQVKRGDTLFQLDPTSIQQEITRAEAELKKQDLEEQLAKFKGEFAAGEVSAPLTEESSKQHYVQKETERVQKEITSLTRTIQQKEIAEKKSKIAQSHYISPVSGIFLYDDAAKLPQQVQENMRVGKIVDVNQLQLVTYVGEQDIFSLKPGMSVEVELTAHKDIKLNGDVVKVSKFAKTGADGAVVSPAQFEVIVSLAKNPNLIAGLSLNGKVEVERKDSTIVVPTLAVMKDSEGSYVMLKSAGGTAKRQNITVGLETADKTEVLEGLKPGDQVTLQ